MAKLYIMVGIPGSGKSTIARQIEGGTVVSLDEIRDCIYGSEEIIGNLDMVFSIASSAIKDCLLDNRDVVYDATSVTEKTRNKVISLFKEQADEIIGVVCNTPLEECLRRNSKRERKAPESVIRKFYERFEIPTTYEGFNKIIFV